jgi:hypothetical protein
MGNIPWFWRLARGLAPVVVAAVLGGCGVSTPGQMEWVQPRTAAARVGTVIMIRGWEGVFSPGIDAMAKQINEQGGTAVVYMPEQYPELAAALVKRYKDAPDHEPLCFVGHSRGVDSALIIARELDKVNVAVDVICCLDSVDEVTVPKNVRVCYNYWMPGAFGRNTNLLRGIPLVQAPGSTGKLFNYDLSGEYRHWRGGLSEHISMDVDSGIQKRIVENILVVCVERAQGAPPATRQ